MDKMIVTVFNNEAAAYEGSRALQDLHWQGSITLYGSAVITKGSDGSVAVKQAADEGPWGTVLGMATGSLIGLLGGPVGVAIGAGAGALSGLTVDLARTGVSADFVDEVGSYLEEGMTAVVAEVDEEWTTPIDTRMAALGGKVFRRGRYDVVDDQIEQDLTAMDADLAQAEAELAQASNEAKARLQARVETAKAKLHATREKAAARIETLRTEADARVKAVQAQAKKADAERKAKLEARAAEIRADYDRRIAKLQQASQLRREAKELTQVALKP